MFQKNILSENEMLETLSPPLKVSHKLFEGKHVLDVQKPVVVFGDVLENVFTFVDTHADLVQFLSTDLMQMKKKRQDLVVEDAQLAARESRMELLLVSLLPKSPPSTPQPSDPDHAMPDSTTPDKDIFS